MKIQKVTALKSSYVTAICSPGNAHVIFKGVLLWIYVKEYDRKTDEQEW